MRSLLVMAAVALGLTGCAATQPKTPQALAEANAEHVKETVFRVAVPISKAFSNVQRKARECWPISVGIIAIPLRLEAEPFDAELGHASVVLRNDGGFIHVGVIMTPEGEAVTKVVGRAVKITLNRMVGSSDLPFFGDWAEGKPVACTVWMP